MRLPAFIAHYYARSRDIDYFHHAMLMPLLIISLFDCFIVDFHISIRHSISLLDRPLSPARAARAATAPRDAVC